MDDKRRGERRQESDVDAERGLTGLGERDQHFIGRKGESDLPIRSREEMEERGADKALQDPDAPKRVQEEAKGEL